MTRDLSMPLLLKVVIAIVLGVLYGQLLLGMLGSGAGEVLRQTLNAGVTLGDLFGRYINFFVPILLVGLVAPAIADFGKNASKILMQTMILAYCSAFVVCSLAWLVGDSIISSILSPGITTIIAKVEINSLLPKSFVFNPFMGVISAIALAFSIGLASAFIKTNLLGRLLEDIRKVVIKVLSGFIVPLLPYHIGIIFAKLSAQGSIWLNLMNFANIIMIIVALQLIYLLVLYLIAGIWTGRNPLQALKNALPAYFTALGTQSSTATIPVSLQCAEKNGVSADVRDFVIPLCATVHLTGSAVTQTFGAMAVYYIFEGVVPSFAQMFPLIIFLGIILIAAPGIPGGAPAATVPVLKNFLGFSPDMSGMMYTLGITNDAFSTAANVAGDGAIAMIIDKKYQKTTEVADAV